MRRVLAYGHGASALFLVIIASHHHTHAASYRTNPCVVFRIDRLAVDSVRVVVSFGAGGSIVGIVIVDRHRRRRYL